jgi:hypothetical protein
LLLLLLHRISITATKVVVVVLVVVLVLQLLIRIPRVAFSRKRIHSLVLLISLLKRHVLLLCLLSSSYTCIRRISTTIITASIHRHHRRRSSDTTDGLSGYIFPVRIGAVHPRFERLVVVKFRVVPQFRFGHFLPRFVLFELKLFEKERERGQTHPDVKRTTTISRCFAHRENSSTRGEKSGFRIKMFTNETKEDFEKIKMRYKERTPALPPPNEVNRPKNPPPDPPLLAFSAILF